MTDQPIARRDAVAPTTRQNVAPSLLSLSRMTSSKPATNAQEALVQALACFADNYGGLFTVAPNSVLLWLEVIGHGTSPELIAFAALAHIGDTAERQDGSAVGDWPPRPASFKARIQSEMQRRARVNPTNTWRREP